MINLAALLMGFQLVNSDHPPTRKYWRERLGVTTPLDKEHQW